jgi:hypothetical protein
VSFFCFRMEIFFLTKDERHYHALLSPTFISGSFVFYPQSASQLVSSVPCCQFSRTYDVSFKKQDYIILFSITTLQFFAGDAERTCLVLNRMKSGSSTAQTLFELSKAHCANKNAVSPLLRSIYHKMLSLSACSH